MDTIREETERKYADIIHMRRPEDERILRKHPRMPVADRAKIFSPFAALRGHHERLAAEADKLLRRERPALSNEETQRLSDRLLQLKKGMMIGVSYFLPESPSSSLGYYKKLEGRVTSVDLIFRTLEIEDTLIRFEDLTDIYGKDFPQSEVPDDQNF